jgi:dTMP kinase
MNKLQIYNFFKSNKNPQVISFEGIDGSGKGTQINKLKEYLESKGKKVKIFSFPNYESKIGKIISSYLRGELKISSSFYPEILSLLYSMDRLLLKEEICSLISKGYIILIDRYTHSNIFQMSKIEGQKEKIEFLSWFEDLEFKVMNLPSPDFVFLLHVDQEVSSSRIKKRKKRDYQQEKEDINEENIELLKNVSKLYLEIQTYKDNWFLINQEKNGEELDSDSVFSLIKQKIDKIFNL